MNNSGFNFQGIGLWNILIPAIISINCNVYLLTHFMTFKEKLNDMWFINGERHIRFMLELKFMYLFKGCRVACESPLLVHSIFIYIFNYTILDSLTVNELKVDRDLHQLTGNTAFTATESQKSTCSNITYNILQITIVISMAAPWETI